MGYGGFFGEVSERLMEPVSKTGVPFTGTAGSNPALSVDVQKVSSRIHQPCFPTALT